MNDRIARVLPLLFLAACASSPPPSADVASPAASSAPAAVASVDEAKAAPAAAAATPSPASSAKASAPAAVAATPAASSSATTNAQLLTGLSSEEVFGAVDKSGALFNDCYTIGAGVGKGKSFKGTVKVKATVGPSGTVNAVEVLSSTAKNTKVDACVKEAFKKIKFPSPHGGSTAVITFPLSFDGVQQVQ